MPLLLLSPRCPSSTTVQDVLFCCRRVDRRLRLVAVATEESVEEETEKDSKTVLVREDDPLRTKLNDYGPEPRALTKDTTARHLKNPKTREMVAGEYCPMNGAEMSDYLQPRSDELGTDYVPMGPPPDYDACVFPHPTVSYANTENGEPNVDSACEKCSMLGYDVLPPPNVYSEIPEDVDNGGVDDEGSHIYESLDQAQPQ